MDDQTVSSSRPSKSLLINTAGAQSRSFLGPIEAGLPLFAGTGGDPHIKLDGETQSEVRLAFYVDGKRGDLMLSDVQCRFPVEINGRRPDYSG